MMQQWFRRTAVCGLGRIQTVLLAGVACTLLTVGLAAMPVLAASEAGLQVRVSGDHFVDGAGKRLRLQGVNVSGLEFTPIHGWAPAAPWGGQTGTPVPDWALIRSWGVNIVRIPLNQASWLGQTCVDPAASLGAAGAEHKADPGGNYQDAVKAAVSGAQAQGMLVILDLHWSAPANFCPLAQNGQADEDHSVAFWKSIATTFRSSPGVMFELFNEPFSAWMGASQDPWKVLRDGGSFNQIATGGMPFSRAVDWKAAGMQKLLDTIRATGAGNVVIAPGVNYTSDLSRWLSFAPSDTRHQLAVAWHAYPKFGATFGSAAYTLPNYGEAAFSAAKDIMAAGYPVLITEFGDHNAPGTTSAPFASTLLPRADAMGIGYLGWAWDVWQNPDHVLIKDAAGTPSAGYGEYVKQHYLCRAGGAESCR